MGWHELAAEADLAPGERRTYRSPIGDVTVFNHKGELFALEDACPHQGASLGEGVFHDGRVICPWHSWVFDVKSGECPRGTHEPARPVALRVRDGRIEIEVDDA